MSEQTTGPDRLGKKGRSACSQNRWVGLSLSDFRRFAARRDFSAAIEEAKERYRDTLAAGALMKRYDPTFVRHLLFEEEKDGQASVAAAPFSVEIRVVE